MTSESIYSRHEFLRAAKALATREGIGITAAMSRIATERPELHKAFVNQSREQAKKRSRRR